MTQMHLVPLMAPRLENENHMKDIDFSARGIAMRREAGYAAAMRALERAPWLGEFDPVEGVFLHESMPDPAIAAERSAGDRKNVSDVGPFVISRVTGSLSASAKQSGQTVGSVSDNSEKIEPTARKS